MDMVSQIELCLLIVCKLKGGGNCCILRYLSVCNTYFVCCNVHDAMYVRCMVMSYEFCALCNLTLMLCIWECALAHKALLFSAPRLFCSLLFI